jgi:hypothetical protein
VNEPAMPARAAKRRPLVVANPPHSPSYASGSRLDRTPFDDRLGHAGFFTASKP